MSLTMTQAGLKKLLDRITEIERRLHASGTLKRQVGKMLVAQTVRRISVEKTSPEGRPWKAWTTEYARTRGSGHSLLIDTGALLNSIKARVTKDGAAVTSDRKFASVLNERRKFLGLSRDNKNELDAIVSKWMERL
jgi:phage gpG-like protein